MSFPRRLVLATRNPGKVREVLRICAGWPVEWLTDLDASWPDVEETGGDYLANARLKARTAARALGVPALADDSGIEVDALGGGPGPESARFAGPGATDRENLELLLERVRGVPEGRRTARYRCLAVCVWPDGREVWAEGVCEGRLVLEPRGTGGFGYDPIFVPEGLDRTMAELAPEEKDAVSHRGRAFRALGERLGRYNAPPRTGM
ncbi:MAG TPA: RdgB/HAM1 family non-canonical purine NTP pyrophosphatase [Actinomycetota bacterium]|nr:RdgB/HAM1 family non-canonical purine NTP pyrophosphatase [Actinomycetota bacterium]